MTAEELELEAREVIHYLYTTGYKAAAETVEQLVIRYRAARIKANNYEKALEALDHAK